MGKRKKLGRKKGGGSVMVPPFRWIPSIFLIAKKKIRKKGGIPRAFLFSIKGDGGKKKIQRKKKERVRLSFTKKGEKVEKEEREGTFLF